MKRFAEWVVKRWFPLTIIGVASRFVAYGLMSVTAWAAIRGMDWLVWSAGSVGLLLALTPFVVFPLILVAMFMDMVHRMQEARS